MPNNKSGKASNKSNEQPASAEQESKPALIIECPSELGPIAHQWDRIVPLLAADDRITELDRGPLAIYCSAYAGSLEP